MKIIKTIFALALAALTLSCSNLLDDSGDSSSFLPPAGDGMAYISVNVTNQEKSTRTLIPTIEISDLVLKGGLTGTEEKVLASAESLEQMESRQIVIQTGKWSFTLTAKVSGKEFTSRAVTKTIESRQENPLSFTLEPVNTSGELDFTINFTGREGLEYKAAIIVDNTPLTTLDQETGSLNVKNTFTDGSHTIEIQFRAKNVDSSSAESEILNIYKSIFRIKRGVTTKAVVDNFNLNEVYSIDYEGFDSSADSIAAGEKMILKFSRKYTESAGSEGYITLPRLSNSNMTFSGWYTSAINSEGNIDKYAALVPLYDASGNPAPADANPTDPLYTQKIKVSDNLSDQTLYAKWLINAGGNVTLANDYKFNFNFLQNNDSDTAARGFYPGQAGKFKLSAEVKLGDEVQTIPASDITWTVQLLNGGIVTDKTPSYENGILTIPSITLQDKYTLKVRADYLGIAHDASFDYDVSYAAENAAAWISSLAGAGIYDVNVEGGVASGENEGLAQVAKAIKARPAGVYINLDAAATSASSEITSYNDGKYFKDCSALKSIRLPSWMEYVIHDLFNGCTSLESISMSESTQYIGKDAFKDCTSLTSITLQKDITGASSGSHIHGIDTGAFAGCTSLADIYYEGTISDWAGVNQGSGWYKDVPASVIHCIDGDSPINPLAATPLTLEAKEAGAVVTFSNKASGPVTYKVNGGAAQTIDSGTSGTVTLAAAGDKVQFYGDNTAYGSNDEDTSSYIECSKDCYVYGNIMSLIKSSGFENETELTADYTFAYLFKKRTTNVTNILNKEGQALLLPATKLTKNCYSFMFNSCTKLTSAPKLPATELADYCYRYMFRYCNSITTAPELPATNLKTGCYSYMFDHCPNLTTPPTTLPATSLKSECYRSMFEGCSGLTSAPALPATTLDNYCYNSMFSGCTSLTAAPVLSATTLASNCYQSMFSGCTNLTTAPTLPAMTLTYTCYTNMFLGCTKLEEAPALPATTLAVNCYQAMFQGCTSLTSAPALPATKLESYCYKFMFYGCTSLATAPALPATTLANSCYQSMFKDCTGLSSAPALPATTLDSYCYNSMFSGCTSLTAAPVLSATTLASNCYQSMFFGCTSLTAAPALPATTLVGFCYESMFYACTSLTTAPELPATKLEYCCYQSMFRDCTNLNRVTCLATDISAEYCTYQWLSGVASTGTFINSAGILGWSTGESGIPEGWTVAEKTATVADLTEAPTSGTYSLSSLKELKKIKDWVSDNKTLQNVTFTLEDDIDTNGEELIIGYYKYSDSANRAFMGVFDGNNHSITNSITASGINESAYIALFSYVKGSSTVIKNLTVKGTSTRGSIVGYLDGNASVENCISETVITTSVENIGGILCRLEKGYVRNCINKGAITSTSNTEGGIVGYTNSGSGSIDRCINYGNISGRYSGGIVGYMQSNIPITNCKNSGNITGTGDQVGGLIGSLNTTPEKINNNCNLGEVNTGSGIIGTTDANNTIINNNCNANTAQYGMFKYFSTYSKTLTAENNYSVKIDGKTLYPSTGKGSFDPSTITESQIKSFELSEAGSVVESLNTWATTNSTSSLPYASWKLNADDKPELDLGEMDTW